jgi:hypothetical protein
MSTMSAIAAVSGVGGNGRGNGQQRSKQKHLFNKHYYLLVY